MLFRSARNNLGVTFNGLGQPRDAIVEFGRALALDGTLARAWFNLGVAHASLGEMAMARRAYQRGLDLDPLNPRALYNLAILDAREGRLEESVAGLERAAAIDDRSADLHNELGRAYLAVGRSADAVRQFEWSLELDPASEASRANLALARSQASGLRRR